MIRRVQVTLEVEIDLPDDITEEVAKFMIEENGCPGTGLVGRAIQTKIKGAGDTCWGCAMKGANKLL